MQMQESKPRPVQAVQGRMSLGTVTKGKIAKPKRIVLYGTEGIGKSTFAADAPSPIFLCGEAGTEHLDVARFPEPQSWRDVMDALDALMGEHTYRTIAVDTLDWLEPLCWAQTIATKKADKKIEHIEDFGFAKGYVYALDTWRQMLGKLDLLRDKRGMHVVLIAHSQVKTFKSPDTEDFERYELKLHHKASGLIKEWADCVLFAMHETATHKQNNRTKGVATGRRVIYSTRTAAYDAKNRDGLPEELPLSWEAFESAVAAGVPPATWRERIGALLAGADEALAGRVNAAVTAAAEDATRLAKIFNKLSVTLASKEGAR